MTYYICMNIMASNRYWGRENRCPSNLLAEQGGQTTVEYMLITAVIIMGMAVSLEVLFGALSSLLSDLGIMVSSPYP
jgi:Flp pilus assembly pilin Flp